ncbi:DUF4184 family protein [Streptomyces sp. C10-9-1]|uniref:DUF4184 family protein n=1 Tax=Streptomyces sp. C10-9-1 TaxID=1859285 RepID=UPI00211257B9|nr:DUF4184 family protein [Streptomyces sp. C10-9-1]MCQ6556131.1 DUF4184 family protein [Streptomyces sp. C10-9-1]
MPFTLSHAAAVLPLLRSDGSARGPLVASGLVLGTMAPDATYFAASFVPGAMEFGSVTHSPAGVFTVDAAVAALLFAGWLLVRDPLVALLPGHWRTRTHPVPAGAHGRAAPRRPPLVRAAAFYASAVVGASTHVVWDAFTHPGRWGVRLLPVLDQHVAGFPLYTFVQYGSSAAALLLLVWAAASAVRRAEPVAPRWPRARRGERRLAAAVVGLCVAAGVLHRCLVWYWHGGRVETVLDIVPTACFGGGAGLAAGLLLYGAAARTGAAARWRRAGAWEPPPGGGPQWAADSQSGPTPTETSSGARRVTADDIS